MIQDINSESLDFELQKKQEAYNNLQQAKIEDDQEKGNIWIFRHVLLYTSGVSVEKIKTSFT